MWKNNFFSFIIVIFLFILSGCASSEIVHEEDFEKTKDSDHTEKPEKNIDLEVTPEPVFNPKLTNDPVFLPVGTDGCYGKKAQYVFFGDWPQSLKKDDVLIDKDYEPEIINGWKCYTGSDGFYYVKVKASSYEHRNKDYHFENGDFIENGWDYFFKLEPVKWCVISNIFNGENKSNNEGKSLLVAENILDSCCFYKNMNDNRIINNKTVYPNNYKYSTVRAYLNSLDGSAYGAGDFKDSGFLNKAFSPFGIKNIAITNVDNSANSAKNYNPDYKYKNENKYACENTDDYIFLLSKNEITNKDYGYKITDDENNSSVMVRKITDYAKATGAGADIGHGDFNNNVYEEVNEGWWWQRSPYLYKSNESYRVFTNGNVYRSFFVNDKSAGVVPGVVLKYGKNSDFPVKL